MRELRNQFYYKMAKFLYDRNGYDNLAKACNMASIIFLVINIFVGSWALYLLWMVFLVYSIFRVCSKNISKRYAENQKYLKMTEGLRGYAKLIKLQWRDRAVSRYYICKGCRQHIRVPKGKGKIEIRCPRCGERFIRRT